MANDVIFFGGRRKYTVEKVFLNPAWFFLVACFSMFFWLHVRFNVVNPCSPNGTRTLYFDLRHYSVATGEGMGRERRTTRIEKR